ncbi:MAG: Gfo/Idh/MocA family oxidoreductase [Anaerolineales bacterium]|nr:Gfo/Idh/MocA family oxidoreductase [Anaerolineales bacterium]
MTKNFAITGVGGYIAPRHLKAIYETGHRVVAAVDPKDSVGLLDRYDFDISFFTEFERFDRHLEKLRRGPEPERVHLVSVCAPNYLHDAHCRLALRVGADVICEKPLVINPWNLDALQELEAETGQRIYTVLQLRLHPKLIELRNKLLNGPAGHRYQVDLTYITARGIWYRHSWKGDPEKSGGVATNIGIHFFDLLMWLFGPPGDLRLYHSDPQRMAGYLELERAQVRWFLSTEAGDLPYPVEAGRRSTYRSITIDGEEIEFSGGFTDLHTRVYQETLAGRGFGIAQARPSIKLVSEIRHASLVPLDDRAHPLLKAK